MEFTRLGIVRVKQSRLYLIFGELIVATHDVNTLVNHSKSTEGAWLGSDSNGSRVAWPHLSTFKEFHRYLWKSNDHKSWAAFKRLKGRISCALEGASEIKQFGDLTGKQTMQADA